MTPSCVTAMAEIAWNLAFDDNSVSALLVVASSPYAALILMPTPAAVPAPMPVAPLPPTRLPPAAVAAATIEPPLPATVFIAAQGQPPLMVDDDADDDDEEAIIMGVVMPGLPLLPLLRAGCTDAVPATVAM